MVNCNNCIRDLTNTINKSCKYCNYSICLQCITKYFKEYLKLDCMNCHVIYSRKYIYENFSKNFFIKTFNEIMKDIVFQKELIFMDQTHNEIEKRRKINEYNDLLKLHEIGKYINNETKRIKNKEIIPKNNFILNEKEYNNLLLNISKLKKSNNIFEFISKCNQKSCSGLISKNTEKCNICEIKYCLKCFEQNDDNHKCNSDTIKTINLLNSENYKNCPKCFIKIKKTDGCDHMFCVNCNTGFNWKTMKLILKNNTNPHYYDFIRRNRNQISNSCDVELNENIIILLNRIKSNYSEYLQNICENLMHIREIEIINNEYNFNTNIENRINFLLKKITIEEFKNIILKKYKSFEKQQDLNNIYNLGISLSTEIIYKFLEHRDKKQINIELINLRKYLNNLLMEHKQIYNPYSKYILEFSDHFFIINKKINK